MGAVSYTLHMRLISGMVRNTALAMIATGEGLKRSRRRDAIRC
jgi:hypothetical protein